MFFIVAFGFVALGAAGYYAYRPNPRSLGFIVWMGAATFFSTLMGIAADFGATFFHVSHAIHEGAADWHADLVEGLAESMSPAIMGFAFLGVTALVGALGKARDARG